MVPKWSNSQFTGRRTLVFALLVIAVVVLLVEIVSLAPIFLERSNDYNHHVNAGLFERLHPNQCSFETVTYYPLPTILWVFVPLSLLPNWFVLVWTIAPFVFPFLFLKKIGGITWLYYPLLAQAGVGSIDGWLLLPLYWLLNDYSWLAGIGAALVLFKPQIAFFTVLYAIGFWLVKKNWRNLGAFAATMALIYLPAFVSCPTWPLSMLALFSQRTSEDILPTRGITLWAWAWHGGLTLWLLPFVALATTALIGYVFFVRRKRAQAIQLFGLLVIPVLYVVTLVTAIPTLKTRRQIIILTIISWVGVAIDTLAGGWGGAYVIIPITALVLLAQDNDETVHQVILPPISSPQALD